MIIRFEVANYRSFNDPVAMQLTPSRERQHAGRIPRHDGIGQRILPTSAIYGPNASGKTNLTDALLFLQQLVLAGTEPNQVIQRSPFKLDPAAAERPTRFELDFVAPDDRVFRYALAISDREVVTESLHLIRASSEVPIFQRPPGVKRFDVSGLEALTEDAERRAFFRFTAEGTRANQPFLHEALEREISELDPVFRWFGVCLAVIGPESRPIILEDLVLKDETFRDFLRDQLRGADTGIDDIETDDRLLDEIDDIPTSVREGIRKNLKQNEVQLIRTGKGQAVRYLVRFRDGEIWACRLRATRKLPNGKSVAFNPDEESDGTRRYMDLALAFYSLSVPKTRNVFVVDELDRSLHPVLCRAALEAFLAGCDEHSRNQFIITTHDVTLMTQEVFRRDELWLMEKNQGGASQLFSLGEFRDLRNDKELRRNYLQGRFGGVPIVRSHPRPVQEATNV